jgi:hypothetical protein
MYAKGVRGIEELSLQGIKEEIDEGGRFVQYLYVVSFVLFAQWKVSDVYFIYADEGKVTKGLQYSLFSLVVGIWGIRSLFWTLESIGKNLSGGIDVTNDIVDMLDDQTYHKALSTWINRRYNS